MALANIHNGNQFRLPRAPKIGVGCFRVREQAATTSSEIVRLTGNRTGIEL
jgi:hypothetical protein